MTASALVVRGATIVPMARRGEVLLEHDLLAIGGEIATIGPSGTLQVPPGAQELSGRGRLLLPGFVNAHGHAGLALFAGSSEAMSLQPWLAWLIPRQVRMSPDDVYWSSLLACLQQTRHGVTTLADMLYLEEHTAPAVVESGLRGVLSYSLMETDPIGPDDRQGRRQLDEAVDFAARWHGAAEGRIAARLGPHSVYGCRLSLLAATADAAARGGWGLQVHCSENADEVVLSLQRYGRTPPRVLHDSGCLERPALLAHAVQLSDEDLDLVSRPNVAISHNPGSNLKLRSGIARVPELVRRGLAVGLGTDSAASNDSLDLIKEAYLAAVLHPWEADDEPAWAALELATIGGARALGLGDSLGSLEPGKQADLVLIERDRLRDGPANDPVRGLVYCGRGDDVRATVVAGEVLYEDGRFSHLDADRIVVECRQRAARLVGETPKAS